MEKGTETDLMRKRILYLHNKSDISGGERSLLNLWENLDREKYLPFLIVPCEGPFAEAAGEAGIKVSFYKVPEFRLTCTYQIIKAVFWMNNYIKRNRIDLIHSYTPRNNALSALASKCKHIPVIWHERNMMFQDDKDITKIFMFMTDKVICNSNAVAERFMKKGSLPPKVKVILNGVNLEKYKDSPCDGKFKEKLGLRGKKVVGLVSNLGARKRVEFLIDAAGKMKQKMPDVKFVIVGGDFTSGDHSRQSVLMERVHGLGLDDSIVFTGFCDNVYDYINVFDVSVNVTLKEACSRAILESMAAGKPVVAVRDGGNGELIEDGVTGVLTDPFDVDAFVSELSILLADEEENKIMGKKARERAESKFDIKRNILETVQVYEELLNSK